MNRFGLLVNIARNLGVKTETNFRGGNIGKNLGGIIGKNLFLNYFDALREIFFGQSVIDRGFELRKIGIQGRWRSKRIKS